MTKQEFSNQFDLLYNNITSNQAPGLDEYEKSVFLTKAQDDIVKAYFNPRLNKTLEGFDGNEKRQIDFSMITKTQTYNSSEGNFTDPEFFVGRGNKKVSIASDIMMFINELVSIKRGKVPADNTVDTRKSLQLVVLPLSYIEINRVLSKPYKRPNHYQAWRIIDNSLGANTVELVVGANDEIQSYTIRYIKKPYPIILEELQDGLTINGKTLPFDEYLTYEYQPVLIDHDDDSKTAGTQAYMQGVEGHSEEELVPLYEAKLIQSNQACELDPILHEEILQRAVELAKAAWDGTLNSQIALGTNSGTNIGMVAAPSRQQ